MQAIPRVDVTAPGFDVQRLIEQGQPVVLCGLLSHWPALQASHAGLSQLISYLRRFDQGREVDTLLLAPETQGKVGYADPDLTGFNFERRRYPVWAVLQQLQRSQHQSNAVRIALQSARVDECLPGFSNENPMLPLPAGISGRIWIGNQAVVPAHFDHADNMACVLAGSRTFTLFPPEQVANLYIGPLQNAPTGSPISLVDITQPDLQRFPKFAGALEAAVQATLVAGEVLFLPALWWHHVQARESCNILINYWWGGSVGDDATQPSPYDAMLHALMALEQVPAGQRQAWQAFFDYFVFRKNADGFAHLPSHTPAIQKQLSETDRQDLLQWLQQQLQVHLK